MNRESTLVIQKLFVSKDFRPHRILQYGRWNQLLLSW